MWACAVFMYIYGFSPPFPLPNFELLSNLECKYNEWTLILVRTTGAKLSMFSPTLVLTPQPPSTLCIAVCMSPTILYSVHIHKQVNHEWKYSHCCDPWAYIINPIRFNGIYLVDYEVPVVVGLWLDGGEGVVSVWSG